MNIAEKRLKAAEEKKRKHREKQILAISLMENGHPVSEIAKTLGVSESTVKNYILKGDNND